MAVNLISPRGLVYRLARQSTSCPGFATVTTWVLCKLTPVDDTWVRDYVAPIPCPHLGTRAEVTQALLDTGWTIAR